MNLENKKEHILRSVKLGLNLFKAELIAECTDEEVDILDNDEGFKKLVKQQSILEEYNLLQKHEEAITIATSRGNSAGIQWKLEKINPQKWADKEDISNPLGDMELTVNLIGKGNDS